MNEKSGDTKKKKNGAHTHVRTTVQLDERNIHVGCCLFSHDSTRSAKTKQQLFWLTNRSRIKFGCTHYRWFFKKKRKKTEHTRMYAQLCSSTNEIFTSVVVYSRTKKTKRCHNKNSVVCIMALSKQHWVTASMIKKCEEKKKKKNGAHTHVRTTVQLGERNIHVGCCLFSHNKKINAKTKNEVAAKVASYLRLLDSI